MKISNEERQQRINQIEKENEALKKLNDLSEIKKRVQQDKSLTEQLDIVEEDITIPVKKIASPENESTI